MRRCPPDDAPPRHRPRPDRCPHGRGDDLACASTGIPTNRWVIRSHRVYPRKARPLPGFFVFPGFPSRLPPLQQVRFSPMKHFLNTQDLGRAELDALLAEAARFKRELGAGRRMGDALAGKAIALVFFNASLRTRTSFELGAFQLGGHAVVLQPGKDAWPIEFDLGTVMDGEAEEHI